MIRKRIALVFIVVALAWVVLSGGHAWAEQDRGSTGDPALVHLDFQVNLPTILFLRIGSAGNTIDTVSFSVTDIPENQPTVPGSLSPDVRVGAIVADNAPIRLRADSSGDMLSGGDNMPFSTISCTGTGDFSSVSGLAFDTTANQLIWSSTGRGFRQGTFAYTYTNSYDYPPGTYTGTVTYTLSAP